MIKIAITEDHTKMREFIVKMIELYANAQVIAQTTNGLELIEWLEQADPLPDLCISDVSMPVLGGYETVKHILAQWPDMKVLMLSTDNSEETVQKMIGAGARGYFIKGADPMLLAEAIRSIHETGYFINPELDYNF